MCVHQGIYHTYIKRQREIGVKAEQQYEKGSDEVVDGGSARIRREELTENADDRYEGSTDVRTQHNDASVFGRQFRGHPVDGVLINAIRH